MYLYVHIAQSECTYLRDLLIKVGEQGDVSSKVLSQIKGDKSLLSESLDKVTKELKTKQNELENIRYESERMHRDLEESISISKEKERHYEERAFQLESELELVRQEMRNMEGDVRTHVGVLTSRYETLIQVRSNYYLFISKILNY